MDLLRLVSFELLETLLAILFVCPLVVVVQLVGSVESVFVVRPSRAGRVFRLPLETED